MAPKKFFARDYIEIHTPASGASIELTTNDPQGFKTGPNLLIDPCILGQSPPPAQGDSISELVSSDDRRIIAADTGKLVTKRDLVLEIFPNPFTGEVSIRYTVPPDCPGDVTLYLRDFTGRQIRTIVHRANAAPGEYQAVFDGSQLASGIYLYELVVCNGAQIVKKAEKISH